jgi:hypothetical protein
LHKDILSYDSLLESLRKRYSNLLLIFTFQPTSYVSNIVITANPFPATKTGFSRAQIITGKTLFSLQEILFLSQRSYFHYRDFLACPLKTFRLMKIRGGHPSKNL